MTAEQGRGFTVVEVLIAAAIVVVGLLALATMFPTGYSTVTKSGIQSTGLALAQQRIEFLRNQAATQTGYNSISGTACPPSITVPAGYACTQNVVPDPTVNGATVNGAKQVTVTVTLPSAGAPTSQPIVLTTIIAR